MPLASIVNRMSITVAFNKTAEGTKLAWAHNIKLSVKLEKKNNDSNYHNNNNDNNYHNNSNFIAIIYDFSHYLDVPCTYKNA